MTDALIGLAESLGLSSAATTHRVADLAAMVENGDADIALELIVDISRDLDVIRQQAVLRLRAAGFSWAEIAAMLEISAAAVHKRFGSLDPAVVRGGNNLTRTKGIARKPSKG